MCDLCLETECALGEFKQRAVNCTRGSLGQLSRQDPLSLQFRGEEKEECKMMGNLRGRAVLDANGYTFNT